MTEEKKIYVEFKTIEKYPDMSPAEFRETVKKFQDIGDQIDALVDEVYAKTQVVKKAQIALMMKQLELKAAVFGGLVKEENEKYTQLKEQLNDKS